MSSVTVCTIVMPLPTFLCWYGPFLHVCKALYTGFCTAAMRVCSVWGLPVCSPFLLMNNLPTCGLLGQGCQ